MKTARIAYACCCMLGLGVAGCETGSRSHAMSEDRIDLDLEPSTRELLVGETVTITARVHDTYGRDADLKWSSTAGDLDTEQNGRVARVKFTQPGTYTVAAKLTVDGREVQHDYVEIRVKPLS